MFQRTYAVSWRKTDGEDEVRIVENFKQAETLYEQYENAGYKCRLVEVTEYTYRSSSGGS